MSIEHSSCLSLLRCAWRDSPNSPEAGRRHARFVGRELPTDGRRHLRSIVFDRAISGWPFGSRCAHRYGADPEHFDL
jgi:hypothetical protein